MDSFLQIKWSEILAQFIKFFCSKKWTCLTLEDEVHLDQIFILEMIGNFKFEKRSCKLEC